MNLHVRRTLPARYALAALGAGLLLAAAAPLSASAHVTLAENQASPGSSIILTFKVPNETADGATTDRVTVSLPTDKPLVNVRFVPIAGWTAAAATEQLPKPVVNGDDTITQAITKVTWTAQAGNGIPPGALGLFQLQVGPIPSVGSISFPTDQAYSDGSTVSWSDKGEKAEHPAPVLYVNDAPPADAHGGGTAAHGPSPTAAAEATSSPARPDVVARGLGIAGLVVGAVGIVVAIAARRQSAGRLSAESGDRV
jgi:uncharacterized protein YcnI